MKSSDEDRSSMMWKLLRWGIDSLVKEFLLRVVEPSQKKGSFESDRKNERKRKECQERVIGREGGRERQRDRKKEKVRDRQKQLMGKKCRR